MRREEAVLQVRVQIKVEKDEDVKEDGSEITWDCNENIHKNYLQDEHGEELVTDPYSAKNKFSYPSEEVLDFSHPKDSSQESSVDNEKIFPCIIKEEVYENHHNEESGWELDVASGDWIPFLRICTEMGYKDTGDNSLLHIAIMSGCRHLVPQLLKGGCDIGAVNVQKYTVLHMACQMRFSDVVQVLLENGVDTEARDSVGRTALHVAAQVGSRIIVEMLCEYGTDINAVDDQGKSALHIAAESGHSAVVESLLSCGCFTEARCKQGLTPLQYALRLGHSSVYDVLITCGALPREEKSRAELCILAARSNKLSVLKTLLYSNLVDDEEKQSWSKAIRTASEGRTGTGTVLRETETDIPAEYWRAYLEYAQGQVTLDTDVPPVHAHQEGFPLEYFPAFPGQSYQYMNLLNGHNPAMLPGYQAPMKENSHQILLSGPPYHVQDSPTSALNVAKKNEIRNCDICGKVLSSASALARHKRLHCDKNSPFQCKECGKCWPSINSLEKHAKIHSADKPFKCDICGKTCRFAHSLRLHLKKHSYERYAPLTASLNMESVGNNVSVATRLRSVDHALEIGMKREENNGELEKVISLPPGQPESVGNSMSPSIGEGCSQDGFEATNTDCLKINSVVSNLNTNQRQCKECGKCFSREDSLRRHYRTHTGEKPFQCVDCGKRFSEKSILQVHSRIHTGMPYECPECKRKFPTRNNLQVHYRIHTGERPYKCKECGKSFTDSSSFKKHCLVHSEETPYKCELCGEHFAAKFGLDVHLRVHTGERPFKCERCGKGFRCLKHLRYHRQTHTNERPYKCEDCGKGYITPYLLKIHRRFHTGEKPYICKDCGEKFLTKRYLEVHQRIHNGDRPYKCEECGKSYMCSRSLMFHRKTHLAEKPYKCEECGRSYINPYLLKDHYRQHTGEKAYKCKVCGDMFSTRRQLTTHVRIHTGVMIYKCEDCGKTFMHSWNLRYHKKNAHGQKE